VIALSVRPAPARRWRFRSARQVGECQVVV